MFDFAEATKDMTAKEILNYYRNLYYAEPQVTERGIVANAINDLFTEMYMHMKADAQKLKYKGKIYYLYDNTIFDSAMNVIVEDATNGFLDLYEYFEYFPPNEK